MRACGTPRRFVYDEDGRLIGEYGNTVATINAEHVWLMPAANDYGVGGGYEPLALVGPSTTSWVHGDHLGTPVMITSSAGARVNDMQATPFGARYRTAAGSPKTALALPGQIIDIADRHYNMHRDYDPTLGRYLQADPIGLDGGDNLYGYVSGNPVGLTDPTGEIAFVPILIGIGLGYAFDYGLEQYKKAHCTCQGTTAGPLGNSAAGGVLGGTGPFVSKPRGGIAGGGPSGPATSAFSELNHAAASRGSYSTATRNRLTKVLRKVPYLGGALITYELYDTFSCDQ